MRFPRYLSISAMVAALSWSALLSDPLVEPLPDLFIGYTEFRTDLPGGRYINAATMRAVVVKADSTGRRLLAEDLTREPGSWTQFTGWTPDGKAAKLSRNWKSEEVGKWEEEHKTFRSAGDGVRTDAYLVDLASSKATLQIPVENKKRSDLIKNLVYGLITSPDGKLSAYTHHYQLYLADGEGSNAKQINTGNPFNFLPKWSPDGSQILFLSGQNYDCHPHLLKPDGTGLKKLTSRNGYRGVTEFLDVYDFHGGSSDYPVWAPDGKSVFYTAMVRGNVELFRIPIDGKPIQITDQPSGTMHYHPQPSPDGKWLVYGSKREGVRQLYLMRLSDKKEYRLTDLKKGHAAMWPHWQPAAKTQ